MIPTIPEATTGQRVLSADPGPVYPGPDSDRHVTAVTMVKLLCCCAAVTVAALRLGDRRIGAVAEAASNPQRARKERVLGLNAESPPFPSPGDAHTGPFSWKESCHQADSGFTIFIPCFREKEEEEEEVEDLHLSHLAVTTALGCLG